jgi:DNA-binding NarL/FixJ family response regulator
MDAKAKIVASNARDTDSNPSELTDIGIQGYLTKACTREELLRTFDHVLHNNHST